MYTSVQCPKCGKIFMYSYFTRNCVCGWEVSEEFEKGLKDMASNKRKKKRKKNRSQAVQGKGNVVVVNGTGGNDGWEVKIDQVTDCSKAPNEINVSIELLAKEKIDKLMKKYPNIEWLAYLLGDKENEPYVVKDIFVPKQEVTSTRVDKIDCPEYNTLPVIGVIHSHHGMGNGFSGTDDEWINQNHNLSLCISHGGIAGQVRWRTPCGSRKIIKVKVKVKYPELDFDFDSWVKESSERINEKTYTYSYNSNYNYGQQPGRHNWNWSRNYNKVTNPIDQDKKKYPTNITQSDLKLSKSQESYCTGASPKEAIKNNESEVWDSGTAGNISTADLDEEQSLEDALRALDSHATRQ